MLLSVRELSARYGVIEALDRVSIFLESGEVVCVLGANGAGKSTLIRAISGQIAHYDGGIHFDGKSLRDLSPVEIARLGVVQCPEGRELFENLTVEENLRLGAARREVKFSSLQADLDFLCALFPLLRERWRQRCQTLSGGEKQMVALARSIIASPRLLLLDEPSLGLAPSLVGEVYRSIPKLVQSGVTVLLVEQNAETALSVSDRGYIFGAGCVTFQGDRQGLKTLLEANPECLR